VTELRKAGKAYFVDSGMRNAVIKNFLPLSRRTDAGSLLEAFALEELLASGFDVKYWRTSGGAEVDVVALRDGDQAQPVPFEVKSGRRGRKRTGELHIFAPEIPPVRVGSKACMLLGRKKWGCSPESRGGAGGVTRL